MSLVQQLEQMRIRMNELAKHETALVSTLGDALRDTDQQLLQEVRRLTAEHEQRRGNILDELQRLASRLNGLPAPVQDQQLPFFNKTSRGLLSATPAEEQDHLRASDTGRGADIRAALNSLNGRANH
jgi:hypothetical protein